ncbi:cytochrome P450 [Mycena sp. CBHHK59/15]|nr:cytochrome P450 [Mycena sp. CBHHK59/15]
MAFRLVASAVAAVLVAHITRILYGLVSECLNSPFRYIPGPPNPSFFFGWFGKMPFDLTQEWQAKYGPTFKFNSVMSTTHLYTVDTQALHRVVNHSEIYQKAPMIRFAFSQLLGRGLIVVEDDEHAKLRKIMSPAFGASQIRELTEIFVKKSVELRNVWASQLPDSSGTSRIDVLAGLKSMTLDVIGLAGFDYPFEALSSSDNPSELDKTFTVIFNTSKINPFSLLQGRFPILRVLPAPFSKDLNAARRTMDRIGMQLIQETKAAIETGASEKSRRDLLSLLLKSNLSTDLPESQRLSDAVVASQLPTIFVAAQETMSTAAAWALYALALHPSIQSKLRDELQTMGTDTPTMDELNVLPYLDKVVKEALRMYAPVVFSSRMAMTDDVLPLGTPYTDTKGVQHDSIPVSKGQLIWIPILAVNMDRRNWGEDASKFNPDRWDVIPESASAIPGIWSHLFTFFGGPHNCIGWRFALANLKALLYTLVRRFEFEMAVLPEDISKSDTSVQRPFLIKKKEKGYQMPLRIKPIQP